VLSLYRWRWDVNILFYSFPEFPLKVERLFDFNRSTQPKIMDALSRFRSPIRTVEERELFNEAVRNILYFLRSAQAEREFGWALLFVAVLTDCAWKPDLSLVLPPPPPPWTCAAEHLHPFF